MVAPTYKITATLVGRGYHTHCVFKVTEVKRTSKAVLLRCQANGEQGWFPLSALVPVKEGEFRCTPFGRFKLEELAFEPSVVRSNQ